MIVHVSLCRRANAEQHLNSRLAFTNNNEIHMSSLVLTTQIYAPSGVHPNRQRDAHPPPTLQEGTYTGQT